MRAHAAVALAVSLPLLACESRQVFHEPHPTLARMLKQRRADPYEASSVFADGKVMRAPPPGTVPRDDDAPPPEVTRALLATGRARFEATCGACHGIAGDGESVVATKMQHRPPPSLHEPRIRALSRAQLFAVASRGYGLMPGYSDTLSDEERWSVVAYVQALQLSQGARAAELPPELRAELAREAP